jgi:hypothetical protein
MTEFTQVDDFDTGTFKLEIYAGGTGELFLRISERPVKDDGRDDWSEACLSATEAAQLREFLSRALPQPQPSGDK